MILVPVPVDSARMSKIEKFMSLMCGLYFWKKYWICLSAVPNVHIICICNVSMMDWYYVCLLSNYDTWMIIFNWMRHIWDYNPNMSDMGCMRCRVRCFINFVTLFSDWKRQDFHKLILCIVQGCTYFHSFTHIFLFWDRNFTHISPHDIVHPESSHQKHIPLIIIISPKTGIYSEDRVCVDTSTYIHNIWYLRRVAYAFVPVTPALRGREARGILPWKDDDVWFNWFSISGNLRISNPTRLDVCPAWIKIVALPIMIDKYRWGLSVCTTTLWQNEWEQWIRSHKRVRLTRPWSKW